MLSMLEQIPVLSVITTYIVVTEGVTTIVSCVSPVLQVLDVPPVAVNVAEAPRHIVVLPETVVVTEGLMLIRTVSVVEHWLAWLLVTM